MTRSNFPEFPTTATGEHLNTLKNYALPDFILKLVAKECKSDLAEKGRIEKKLHSMNEKAIDLLYQIFVNCNENDSGQFALYRFYAYVNSMYYKCEVKINEIIPGQSGKNYKIPIAVKENGMYISVAVHKDTGRQVNKKEITKFYNMVEDIKNGEHGTMLYDAVFASSVGFKKDSLIEIKKMTNSKFDSENNINFKTANYENNIFSIIKF